MIFISGGQNRERSHWRPVMFMTVRKDDSSDVARTCSVSLPSRRADDKLFHTLGPENGLLRVGIGA